MMARCWRYMSASLRAMGFMEVMVSLFQSVKLFLPMAKVCMAIGGRCDDGEVCLNGTGGSDQIRHLFVHTHIRILHHASL